MKLGQQKVQTEPQHMAFILLVINGFLIALMLVLAKVVISSGVEPVAYAFWQTFIAGMVLLLFSFKGGIQLNRRIIFYCVISGLTGIAIPNAIAFFLVTKIGSGFTGIMYALPPVFTLLIALAIGLERLNFTRLLGMVMAVTSCVWVVIQRNKEIAIDEPYWYFLGVLIPIMLSIGNIFRSSFWPQGIKPLPLAGNTLLAASSSLALLSSIAEIEIASTGYSFKSYLLILIQGGLTAMAYLCSFELQKRSDPVFLSQLGAVAAVFGLLLGVIWFKESYSPQIWLGVLLVILGLRISNRSALRSLPRGLRTERT